MNLSQRFYAYLCQKYPKLQDEALENAIAPNLLSPHVVELPLALQAQISSIIGAFQTLRDLPQFQKYILDKWGPIFNPGNNGLFMSYDFHVTVDGGLKLIEINTNASFLALGWEMNQFHGHPWNADFKLADLKQCISQEQKLAAFGESIHKPAGLGGSTTKTAGSDKAIKKIVITDDNPRAQRLYLEFALYREIFSSLGYDCEIADISDIEKLKTADLIYNRSTDFYFEEGSSQGLRELYLNKQSVVSPHPYEYRLLADKENFVDWSLPEFWTLMNVDDGLRKTIQSALPVTRIVSEENRNQIWNERKNLFFKPKRAFGSKSAFRGASVARKAFDSLVEQKSLAQEIVPPAELVREMPGGPQTFKYDLRCYAYRDQYQGCVARLYQGQVTNLRTEGGGFAPVLFTGG